MMAYNLLGPSLTLTPDERAAEAGRLLDLLAGEDEAGLQRRLSQNAINFLQRKWLEKDLGLRAGGSAGVAVSEKELLWLRDIWSKFA